MNKDAVTGIILELKDFLQLSLDEEEVYKICESIQLNLAFKFLKSPYMKKRLAGINEIKEIIDSFNPNKWSNDLHDLSSDRESPKFLTPEYLCEWILSNKVLDILLSENSHIELIKRSASLLIFLKEHS